MAQASDRNLPDAGKVPTEPSLIEIVLRRWWVVVLCAVIGAVAAGAYSMAQQKQYKASADLLFRGTSTTDQNVQSVLGLPPPTIAPDPTQQAATNVALVSLGAVSDMTAKALGHGVSPSQVSSEVSVGEMGQSNLVSVAATDPSPTTAAAIANTFAGQVVALRKNLDRSVVESAILGVQNQLRSLPSQQRSGPAGQRLKSRLSQLNTLATAQTGDVQVVQAASIPSSPSLPRTKVNIAAGALLGLILGFLLTLLLHRLDRRVDSPTELADAYGLPVLGVVPRTRELALAHRRSGQRLRLADTSSPRSGNGTSSETHLVLPAPAADAFRAVRTRLRYANPDRDVRSVLVTSANRGEGKSTVAWQLARVVAIQRNRRVLVLECDLRRPILAHAHELRSAPGLVEVLAGAVPLHTAIQTLDPSTEETHFDLVNLDDLSLDRIGQVEAEDKGPVGSTPRSRMDVLVAGSPTSNPADLLDSDQMSALLHDLAAQYDFIVLDAPPGPLVADTFPLVSQVDGVIVVSSIRHTSRDAVNTLRSQLEVLDAPILGVVVNNAKHGDEAGYPYSYRPAGLNGSASTMSTTGAGGFDEFRDVPPRRPPR